MATLSPSDMIVTRAAQPTTPASSTRQSILRDTFRAISERRKLQPIKIVAIQLTSYFTLVELSDGAVGACMSYYRLSSHVMRRCQDDLRMLVLKDPLLYELLFTAKPRSRLLLSYVGDQRSLLEHALQATIVSALSATFLRRGEDDVFSVAPPPTEPDTYTAETALHIGFGNKMDALAADPCIKRLHISDLSYLERRDEMDGHIASLRKQFPSKRITISDGWDTPLRFKDAQLVFIPGCSLCNGTLDDLLPLIDPDHKVIVVGQSASIHPIELFRRGAQMVDTTLKPRELMRCASGDFAGAGLRRYLEGGLPWIRLLPRGPLADRQISAAGTLRVDAT